MQPLRTLAEHCNFTLGAAVTKEPYFFTDPTYRQIHADNFNLCVPANAMKCGSICAQPNQYDFSHAEAFVDFATQHNQAVHGHTLC
ncbi:MAG: endo-1,4-beta-xylanase [Cyanobacteria bacterium J06642_9]